MEKKIHWSTGCICRGDIPRFAAGNDEVRRCVMMRTEMRGRITNRHQCRAFWHQRRTGKLSGWFMSLSRRARGGAHGLMLNDEKGDFSRATRKRKTDHERPSSRIPLAKGPCKGGRAPPPRPLPSQTPIWDIPSTSLGTGEKNGLEIFKGICDDQT